MNKLSFPNHFNPVFLDCRNTSLGQIRLFNSSVFDCQTGNFVEGGNSSSSLPTSIPPIIGSSPLVEKIAIPVGAAVGTAAAGGITYYLYKRYKKRKNKKSDNQNSNSQLIELADTSPSVVKSGKDT